MAADAAPGDVVTEEDLARFCMNVGGFYRVPGALSLEEAKGLHRHATADPTPPGMVALSRHPTLRRHVARIMTTHTATEAGSSGTNEVDGKEFRTDVETHALHDTQGKLAGGAWEADGHQSSGHGFTPHGAQELCPAVRVFWALASSLTVTPKLRVLA